MNWVLAAQIPVLVLGLWCFTAYMTQTFPTLRGKRICLLIAHPDDEAMFFAPTVLWLTRPELRNRVFILCLSSGNAEGLGSIRQNELIKSAAILGVGQFANERDHDHKTTEDSSSPSLAEVGKYVVVLDDEKLPDSMTTTWDSKLISSILTRYFASNVARTRSDEAPVTQIDTLITFDGRGVSGHPNHISLYHGARTFVQSLMQRHAGWECPVQMYTLPSVNVVRKYSAVLDYITTMLSLLVRPRSRSSSAPTPLVMVNTPLTVRKAQRAMTDAHQSQMRWFRWGWIVLSRYMYVNDLSREKI